MSPQPQLGGQTVVVIGGTSGIGLGTARRARDEGAGVIITGRNPDRLQIVGLGIGASIAAFDATDFDRLARFFDELPTARPRLGDLAPALMMVAYRVRPRNGTLRTSKPICCCPYRWLGTPPERSARRDPAVHGRHREPEHGCRTRAHLCADRRPPRPDEEPRVEIAPVRVEPDRNRVRRHAAVGIVARRPDAARAAPNDTAYPPRTSAQPTSPPLAVHLMVNTAATGATFDIDGGQQLIEG